MSDSKYNPVSLVFFLLVMFFLMLLVVPALADDGHGHDHDDEPVNVVVDTLTTVKGSRNRSIGMANAQGDVDIGDCIVTKQWNAVIFARQSWEYNVWCQANDIHLGGQPKRAAEARCEIPFFAKLYGDECVDALTFASFGNGGGEGLGNVDKDEDEDRRDRELQDVMKRLDLYDANKRAAAKRAVDEQDRRNAYADKLEGKQ